MDVQYGTSISYPGSLISRIVGSICIVIGTSGPQVSQKYSFVHQGIFIQQLPAQLQKLKPQGPGKGEQEKWEDIHPSHAVSITAVLALCLLLAGD